MYINLSLFYFQAAIRKLKDQRRYTYMTNYLTDVDSAPQVDEFPDAEQVI